MIRPFSSFSLKQALKDYLDEILPENCHKQSSGRLALSVTKLWTFENELLTHFESRSDLIAALSASCFIPVWSGSFSAPKIKDCKYIDGACSNNVPKFELSEDDIERGVRTITLAPFESDELEVSPIDNGFVFFKSRVMGAVFSASLPNFRRTFEAMLPLRPSRLVQYIESGYEDMKDFLLCNNLIRCINCFEEIFVNEKTDQSSALVSCVQCLKLMEKVDSLKLPESLRIFVDPSSS